MDTVSPTVVLAKCRGCGTDFNAKRPRGPLASYCTSECKRIANYARYKGSAKYIEGYRAESKKVSDALREKNLALPDLECGWCGKTTPRGRSGRSLKFCDKKCRNKSSYARHKLNADPCSVDGCEKFSQSRGLCGSHYAAIWRAANPDKHTAKNLRYRARKKHEGAESFSRLEVLELSDWTCHLCGDPIDRDCDYPNPLYGTVDHVVPLAKGGTHTLDNVKAAHHVCNSTKRDNEDYIHEVR